MSDEREIDEQDGYERWLLDAEHDERRSAAFWRERLCVLLDEETDRTRPDIHEIVARAPLDVVMFLCAQIIDDRFYIERLKEHGEFKRQWASNDPEYFDSGPEGEVVVLYGIHGGLNDDPTTWESRWSEPFRAWLARRRERVAGGPPRPFDRSETGTGTSTGTTGPADRDNSLFIALMIVLGVVVIVLSHQC